MRRMLFAASFGLIAPMALIAQAPAFAAGISVAMDQVHTVTFNTPVATVYVGNPSIADVNMIDARHAFVIGKGFGSNGEALGKFSAHAHSLRTLPRKKEGNFFSHSREDCIATSAEQDRLVGPFVAWVPRGLKPA